MAIPFDPELVDRLRGGTRHQGVDATGGFAYDIDLRVPCLATAIHAGHRVRQELAPLMAIGEMERLFEEDPATDEMVRGTPSCLWALDSRTEYDLNRPLRAALPLTPEQFWGVRVYREPPTPEMNRRSLEKYRAFYRFMASCLWVLVERFGSALVYDIHSYNLSRQLAKGIAQPPVFNLGTELLDRRRWGARIDGWLKQLRAIDLPGRLVTVEENRVFSGKGELCRQLTAWDPGILVLPTEIAKVYMDERQGVLHPRIVAALREGLGEAVAEHNSASPSA
jgi:hypothetical protein